MRRSYNEVRQIAHALPEDQRILLANSLLESVASSENPTDGGEVAAAWNDEVKRRLDRIDSGAVKLIPGDRVRAEIIERLSPQARARLRV
jgi:putative addiction module component (TIGR02574 family)